MSLAKRLAGRERIEERSINFPQPTPFLAETLGYATSFTGRYVSVDRALQLPQVYAAIKVVAENLGAMPCVVYRESGEGSNSVRVPATNTALYSICHEEANEYLPAGELWEIAVVHMCLYGNAYLQKIRNGAGLVTGLWPLPPDRVTVRFDPEQGKKIFTVRTSSNGQMNSISGTSGGIVNENQELDSRSILHLRYMGADGVKGISPIQANRQLLGVALAMQEYKGRFWANSATPAGLLKVPEDISDEALERLKADWAAQHQGGHNHGRFGVVSAGTDWQSIDMPFKDQEFVDQEKFITLMVANMFGVPPWLLGVASGESLTYKTVEQEADRFVKFTLRNWATRIERAIRHDGDLCTDPSLYPCFEMNDLTRADIINRFTTYSIGLSNGFLNVNEVRAAEGKNPIPNGDEYKPVAEADANAPSTPTTGVE